MPMESTPRPLARQLLRVVLGAGDIADRDLLARFATTRDEDAFVELVRRHGTMVLGVCRRVTRHPQDAEDAFQAAFVVLARRAAQVRNPEQLANWLYGVAYRTALEARATRRRVQEQPVSAAPEPAAPPEPDDTAELRQVIDEELAKLPDKYRSAVVLCDIEGMQRATAAAQLQIPEGTLSSRLAQARKLLASRLARRGVTASALAITTFFGRDATLNAVSRELVLLTARVARATAGGVVPPGLHPSVSNLADGVMKTMLINRLRLMLGAVVTCGLLGLGAYGLAQVAPGTPVPNPNQPLQPRITEDPPAITYAVIDPQTGELTQPKQAPKVAAKGIEDDDVPFGASPAQAVVRIEEGKLIVRQRTYSFHPVVQTINDQRVISYQQKSAVTATTHDPADISVFDMKGNRLQPKAWKDKFKADVHVLIGLDGRLPHPRELALFKEDTLLVVVPTPTQPNPGYGHPTVYEPKPAYEHRIVPPAAAPAVPAPVRPSTSVPAYPPGATGPNPGSTTPRPSLPPTPAPSGADSVPPSPTPFSAPTAPPVGNDTPSQS
jgi:RNA polymerase sigma factor (sigma-70 family)